MRLKLIACEVFAREIGALFKESPHAISLSFYSKGLHEIGCALMRETLQDEIDQTVAGDFEAILLAYGMCGLGTTGLKARAIPLVIPRAHDCISILLGSASRHESKVAKHPGVYFRSSGWLERRNNPEQLKALSVAERNGLNTDARNLVSQYGAESGEYLAGILCAQTRLYDRLTYIETGVEPDDRFERASRCEASHKGWKFEKMKGDLALLQKFLAGDWDESGFLIVPPGHTIHPTYDVRLIRSASTGDAIVA